MVSGISLGIRISLRGEFNQHIEMLDRKASGRTNKGKEGRRDEKRSLESEMGL